MRDVSVAEVLERATLHSISLGRAAKDALSFWEYTAQDELRDRLNRRLRGEDPGVPINWRGLP